MTKLIGTRISTKNFFWDKDTRRFIGEASTLQGLNVSSRVFDDAEDIGFVLVSERTNAEIAVVYTKTMRDREGDDLVWIFTSYKAGVGKEFTVHILNT